MREKEEMKKESRDEGINKDQILPMGTEFGKPRSFSETGKGLIPRRNYCSCCGKQDKKLYHIKCRHGHTLCEMCFS